MYHNGRAPTLPPTYSRVEDMLANPVGNSTSSLAHRHAVKEAAEFLAWLERTPSQRSLIRLLDCYEANLRMPDGFHVFSTIRVMDSTNTPMQQFAQGAETIHQALRAALMGHGLSGFHVARAAQGANVHPHDSIFMVTAKEHTESLMFTREEIMDSAQSIDSFANAKVRVLAGRFAD
jgi:hypothetical protein